MKNKTPPQELGKQFRGLNFCKPVENLKQSKRHATAALIYNIFLSLQLYYPVLFYRHTHDEKVLTRGLINKFFETYLANAIFDHFNVNRTYIKPTSVEIKPAGEKQSNYVYHFGSKVVLAVGLLSLAQRLLICQNKAPPHRSYEVSKIKCRQMLITFT